MTARPTAVVKLREKLEDESDRDEVLRIRDQMKVRSCVRAFVHKLAGECAGTGVWVHLLAT